MIKRGEFSFEYFNNKLKYRDKAIIRINKSQQDENKCCDYFSSQVQQYDFKDEDFNSDQVYELLESS